MLGGEQEKKCNKFLHDKFRNETYFIDKIYTLEEYSCIIKRMNIIISVDSLVSYLALLNKIQTIALFSSTCDSEIEMFGCGVKIYANANYLCNCFFKNECKNKCIDTISNEKYYSAIKKILYIKKYLYICLYDR